MRVIVILSVCTRMCVPGFSADLPPPRPLQGPPPDAAAAAPAAPAPAPPLRAEECGLPRAAVAAASGWRGGGGWGWSGQAGGGGASDRRPAGPWVYQRPGAEEWVPVPREQQRLLEAAHRPALPTARPPFPPAAISARPRHAHGCRCTVWHSPALRNTSRDNRPGSHRTVGHFHLGQQGGGAGPCPEGPPEAGARLRKGW